MLTFSIIIEKQTKICCQKPYIQLKDSLPSQ